MPHIIVQHSDNIKVEKSMLLQLNQALFDSGLFGQRADDIKTRSREDQQYVIGLNNPSQAYIHVSLYILSGRTDEQKKLLSQQVLKTLEQVITNQNQGIQLQLCVDVIDMQKDLYSKSVIAY